MSAKYDYHAKLATLTSKEFTVGYISNSGYIFNRSDVRGTMWIMLGHLLYTIIY